LDPGGHTCGSCVGSYESGKLSGGEALVEEELEKAVVVGALTESWRHGVVWGCGAAVGTANNCFDTRACNDCNAVKDLLARVTAVMCVEKTYLEANWIKSAAPTEEPN
jgi:hypothetical protein